MEFDWNVWNLNHIAEHGVTPAEAESIIAFPRRPYPLLREDEKWLVWGRGIGGQFLQIIYLVDEDGIIYVIHGRPLTECEKRRFRKLTGL